jgi:hypothetical protein
VALLSPLSRLNSFEIYIAGAAHAAAVRVLELSTFPLLLGVSMAV